MPERCVKKEGYGPLMLDWRAPTPNNIIVYSNIILCKLLVITDVMPVFTLHTYGYFNSLSDRFHVGLRPKVDQFPLDSICFNKIRQLLNQIRPFTFLIDEVRKTKWSTLAHKMPLIKL